jgi:hypothetical protein
VPGAVSAADPNVPRTSREAASILLEPVWQNLMIDRSAAWEFLTVEVPLRAADARDGDRANNGKGQVTTA